MLELYNFTIGLAPSVIGSVWHFYPSLIFEPTQLEGIHASLVTKKYFWLKQASLFSPEKF